MADEFERIRRLQSLFGPPPAGVTLGIGDDAAVLDVPFNEKLVWTIDACVENVHFRRDIASWEDVGVRSFMAAASDLAAMAARPLGALSGLTLPKDLPDEALASLAQGQHTAARDLGTAVIGGNLSQGDVVTVSTTLIGTTARAPRRDGARPGDVLAICGDVGLAAAGLRLLLRTPNLVPTDSAQQAAVLAWRRPRARIDDGLRCGPAATSLIDVSDGLAQDAAHIAQASGVRFELHPEVVVTSALRSVAESLACDPLNLVLGGGEDYALLGTFPPDGVPDGFTIVGACLSGNGVWVNDRRVDQVGHDHFRS